MSGGERTRLAMVRLLLEPYNVLILDEPTNHLDMRTKDILKDALKNFEGTVIVVSHDRDFLNGLADKVYEFADHRVKEYLGGVSDFLAAKKIACFREYEQFRRKRGEKKGSGEMPEKENEENAGKLSFEERKQQNREIRKAGQKVESIEKEISRLEEEMGKLEEEMAGGKVDERLYKNYDESKKTLDSLLQEWEDAHEIMEGLKNRN